MDNVPQFDSGGVSSGVGTLSGWVSLALRGRGASKKRERAMLAGSW